MSIPPQFIADVDRGIHHRADIDVCLCSGGNIMRREAIIESVNKLLEK